MMLGTGSPDAASDMVTYARDTQHEKVGVGGVAVVVGVLSFVKMGLKCGVILGVVLSWEWCYRGSGVIVGE